MIKRDERGAVIVLTAISMLMIISAVALAVDVGDLVWRKREIQGIVDLGSLDAVRALGDQRDTTQTRCQQATTIAQQSALRNNFDYTTSGYSLDVQLGAVDPVTRVWSLLGDCGTNPIFNSSAANAVKVLASRPVMFSWLPGSDQIPGEGVSAMVSTADIGMGTWAARLNVSNAPQLDKLLYCMGKGGGTCNGSAGVTAVGYSGLASGTINLGSLFTQLGVGSASQLANTSVTYKNFLLAAATVMSNQGDATSAAALNTLAAAADSTLSFKFGDFLDLSSGYGSVASGSANVLELIGASAQVANQTHFIEVDNLGLSIPGVSNINMKMSVIEAPQWKYGASIGDTISNAQVRTEFDISVGSVLVGLTSVPITLKLYVESAGGSGTLTDIACAANPANGSVTINGSTNLVKLYIGEVSNSAITNAAVDPSQTNTVSADTMANVAGLVKITGSGSMTLAPANNANVLLSGAFTRYGTLGTFTTNTDALRNALAVTVTSLGGLLNISSITTSVTTLVNPVLDVADTTILNLIDALPSLNIDLAGADFWNSKTDCTGRKLVN
jgi:uncharacterized membrane protein